MAIVSFGCKKKTTTAPPDPNKCEDFTDARDGRKYKVVKIGEQCWMAENLDYDTGDSTFCYDNDPKYCDTLGKLYVYSAAAKACPDGWRLPTRKEFEEMADLYGGVFIAGKELQEGGSSGFNGKIGGYWLNGKFNNLGKIGSWWSSTQVSAAKAKFILSLFKVNDDATVSPASDLQGNSCRCIKDK
jgi:uncharacterized protein (TIGR02145 family)